MTDEIITLICAVTLFIMAAKEIMAAECRKYDLIAVTVATVTATVIISGMVS